MGEQVAEMMDVSENQLEPGYPCLAKLERRISGVPWYLDCVLPKGEHGGIHETPTGRQFGLGIRA
ncbi:hypothetical protein [Antrihabitans cavernicola]|uniref:Uncharacterized protein n=1 Tax=Antrihabitans cavernicola TaxID=2495913 RepID=A0A5A7S6R4_9NOCA|nr:hypothetical protein [Spelaeibacter cavernicola]KAA0021820.1 hypothetical protein FOY51_15580 [Spelaeibacter cavernicola]